MIITDDQVQASLAARNFVTWRGDTYRATRYLDGVRLTPTRDGSAEWLITGHFYTVLASHLGLVTRDA